MISAPPDVRIQSRQNVSVSDPDSLQNVPSPFVRYPSASDVRSNPGKLFLVEFDPPNVFAVNLALRLPSRMFPIKFSFPNFYLAKVSCFPL